MNIYYSDESSRLTSDIRDLMVRAAETAMSLEFGDVFRGCSIDVDTVNAEVGVSVVTAEEIQELNRDYRGNDSVTDVLSFPQYEDMNDMASDLAEGDTTVLIGDVVICYDRVLSQSEEFGTGIKREFVYLFTHSMLHLLGYDHMEPGERSEMRAREEEIMNSIGVSR